MIGIHDIYKKKKKLFSEEKEKEKSFDIYVCFIKTRIVKKRGM